MTMNKLLKKQFFGVKQFSATIFAIVISLLGFIILFGRQNEPISNQFAEAFAGIVIAIIVVSAIIRFRFSSSDYLLLPLALLLNSIGLLEILRIDYAVREVYDYGDDYAFMFSSQLLFSVVGVIVMTVFVCLLRDHRNLRRYIFTCMFIGVALILLPLIPGLGVDTNGASVWIRIGSLGTVQPAEFAKLFLAIFFAGYLTINRERLQLAGKRILGLWLPRIQDMGPLLLVWLVSLAVLVFQHDLGTSLLFFGMFIAILYVATSKISWTIIGLLLFSGGAFLAYNLFVHVQLRIETWLDPFNSEIYNRILGGSGQVVQGFFALASGGLFGRGIGQGYPTLTPFSSSDFIYSALGEELGLTGMIAILVLYLLLIERAISISLNVSDGFGKLLACGISFSLVLQLFVVVGGVTGLIPLTGLTLPFIARGGSSIIANYLMVGLLIVISQRTRATSELTEIHNSLNTSSSNADNRQKKVLEKESI